MAYPSISHHLVCLCCYWVEGIFKLAYFSFSFLLGQRWAQVYLKHGVCAQSYPTLWDSMDYSLLDSPIPGIFQVSILKWVAISSSRGSSQPWKFNLSLLHLLHWQADSLLWTTREALFETWYNLNISFPSILQKLNCILSPRTDSLGYNYKNQLQLNRSWDEDRFLIQCHCV